MTASNTEPTRVAFRPLPASGPERCGLVGEHPLMLEVFRLMARAAPTLAPVLILGESGTGRESIAHCLHRNSVLSNGPWLVVNCARMTEQQLENELFGEEQESEKGVVTRNAGRIEQSRGGTLFLDDVSALTVSLQMRLLRALQEPITERRRRGDTHAAALRVIASAPTDLRATMAHNGFREDLYFRLAVVTLNVPRLTDRGDDLLLLTAHFADLLTRRAGTAVPVTGISSGALRLLEGHRWLGNVRELRDLVDHAVRASRTDTLLAEDLPHDFVVVAPDVSTNGAAALPSLSDVEAQHIALVLQHTGGAIHTAAVILGVHRNTLTRKIKQYRLAVEFE